MIFALGFLLVNTPSFAKVPGKEFSATKGKKTKKEGVVTSEAGLNIPEWGIAIDAIYDSRLTNLVPGYQILNIVLTNRGAGTINLDVRGDKWMITDRSGRKYSAQNHVKNFDEKLWSDLPSELQQKLDYPNAVRGNKSITIDVFFPKTVDLNNFHEITWKSSHFNREFNVFTNYENDLNIGESKEFDIPKATRPQPFNDADYLKTRDEVLNPQTPTQDLGSNNINEAQIQMLMQKAGVQTTDAIDPMPDSQDLDYDPNRDEIIYGKWTDGNLTHKYFWIKLQKFTLGKAPRDWATGVYTKVHEDCEGVSNAA